MHYLDTTTLVSPVEKTENSPLKKSLTVDSGMPNRHSKILVKALYDFPGKDDEDLPFKKGEILEIVTKQEEQEWIKDFLKITGLKIVVTFQHYFSPVKLELILESGGRPKMMTVYKVLFRLIMLHVSLNTTVSSLMTI